MGALISLSEVSLSLGAKPLFSKLGCHLNPGDQIALVGHNGSGKSSLIGVLSGEREFDAGRRQARSGLVIATVAQFLDPVLLQDSLLDAAASALPASRRQSELYRAQSALQAAGFVPAQFTQTVAGLSGGQQNLLLMVRAILTDPDLLLLDEPGNHMDIVSLARLQQWLDEIRIPWLMVSHDRHLMNAVCRQTWVLRDQRLYCFNLPFDRAREELALQDEAARARRAQEDKEIARIESSAKRLAVWGRTFDNEDLSRKAKTMERRAERLRSDTTFVSKGSGLSLALADEKLQGRQALLLENLTVTAPGSDHVLLRCEYLLMRPGERIGLLGVNGSGKSTTIKRIVAALAEDDATLRPHPATRLGYYEQQLDELDCEASRFDWLRNRVSGPDDAIKQTLLQAGIEYQGFLQPVGELSGGEKARMVFALLRLQRPNFLILDEPTNHIDLEGREELIEALRQSGLTVLITSHDRSFLEQTADRWWLIEAGKLQETRNPDCFYANVEQAAREARACAIDSQQAQIPTEPSEPKFGDDAAMLHRIEELERLLEEDRGRKPKHQKPERQRAWAEELATLWGHFT